MVPGVPIWTNTVTYNTYSTNQQAGLMQSNKSAFPRYTTYYFVLNNDKLLYWGFPFEFIRHDNKELNDIGKYIVRNLTEVENYELYNKIKLLVVLIAVSCLTSSCVYMYFGKTKPYIKNNWAVDSRFIDFEHGMDYDEVLEILAADESSEYGIPYYEPKELELLKANTFDISTSVPNAKIIIIDRHIYDGSSAYYVFAFENNNLIYWDIALDFAKSGDRKL